MCLEGAHRHGDGQIGLAGAGGADGDDDGILLERFDIFFLTQCPGTDGLAPRGDEDALAAQLGDAGLVARFDQIDAVAHRLLVEIVVGSKHMEHGLGRADGRRDIILVAKEGPALAAVADGNQKFALKDLQVFTKAAAQADRCGGIIKNKVFLCHCPSKNGYILNYYNTSRLPFTSSCGSYFISIIQILGEEASLRA